MFNCFKQNETYFASGICKKWSFTQWKWEAHHMRQHITDALAWFRKLFLAHYNFTQHLELFIASNNKPISIQCDITEHCNVTSIILYIFPFFSKFHRKPVAFRILPLKSILKEAFLARIWIMFTNDSYQLKENDCALLPSSCFPVVRPFNILTDQSIF